MQLLPTLWLAGLLAQNPPAWTALIEAAHQETAQDRPADAERLVRQALSSMGPEVPADARVAAHQVLATVLANTGRLRQAWDEIERALALRPQGKRLGGLRHSMAIVSWTAGDLEAAARLMADAVSLLKGSDAVWSAMVDQANLELARGKRTRAMELCREALPRIESGRDRGDPVVVNRIYTCAVVSMERDPQGAEQQLQQLLPSLSPHLGLGRASILAQLARARLLTNHLAAASEAIDQAIALARAADDAQLLAPFLSIRARVLRAMKRKKEAVECEREAASLAGPRRDLVVDARILRAAPPPQVRKRTSTLPASAAPDSPPTR